MNLNDLPDMSEALKQVQAFTEKKANDGNLANNAPPYDRVTRRDVITGRLGKDEMGGKRKKHDCAKKVNYKPDGTGVVEEFDVIPEMHTMLEDGTVTHYDITNGEYIYENVPVEELEILISEKHEHFDNYDKNAEVLGENRRAARAAGGYKDDSKKQPDPSKAGFTGIGNMSIDQIRKMSARIEKEKTKKEEFAAEGVRDEDPEKGTAERKARLEKKRGMKLDDHPQYKKEDLDWFDELAEELGESIDELTDEQLEDLFIEGLQEVDLEELTETLDFFAGLEVLTEASDKYYDSAVKGSKAAAKRNAPSRAERLKSAAKRVGSALKTGASAVGSAAKKTAKAAIGAGARAAGHAKGEFEAQRIKSKRAAMSRPDKKKSSGSTSAKGDDDGTGGKLDALLKKTRGSSGSTSSSGSSGSSSGGGSSSASSGGGVKSGDRTRGETRRAVGGALKKVGNVIKKGVGKTARLVSKGADKVARKLGEEACPACGQDPCQCETLEEGLKQARANVGMDPEKPSCWKGYVARGTKMKGGKEVPNCVPANEELEAMEASLIESGLFGEDEVRYIIGEKFSELEEVYKGKHGQSDKEYADSRSQGGKMVSGDSKQSGAEYTHGRRVKAANPGMQPDVGGKTKPKSQGKMDRGTRADLEYRRANLKKKD